MDLNKFIHNSDGAAFHSTGYAESSNGGSIGSTSSQTFGERVHMERNRQAVRRYGDSLIGQNHMSERTVHRPRNETHNGISRSSLGVASRGSNSASSSIAPRPSFREPPARPFNPYS